MGRERFDFDGYRSAISRAEAEAEAEAETNRNRARNFKLAARLFGREAIGYIRFAYAEHASLSASKAATNYRFYCNVTAGRAYDDNGASEVSPRVCVRCAREIGHAAICATCEATLERS